MMQQPELGKKVSELRTAKGLTQEELAQQCNVNVRTIQRIESSEVNPRMYTIRLIFSELDYDVYQMEGSKESEHKNRLKLFKGFTLDLFNLKTNTMRKVSILASPLALAIVVLFFTSFSAAAQQRKYVKQMVERHNKNFVDYFNSGQIDSLVMNYHVHASMMPTGSPEIKGREAIAEYYYFLYNMGYRFTENKTNKLTIDSSVLIDKGTWRVRMGGEEVMFGYYVTNWRRYKEGWYIESEISTLASN